MSALLTVPSASRSDRIRKNWTSFGPRFMNWSPSHWPAQGSVPLSNNVFFFGTAALTVLKGWEFNQTLGLWMEWISSYHGISWDSHALQNTYWCVLRRVAGWVAGWVAGGCWDDDISDDWPHQIQKKPAWHCHWFPRGPVFNAQQLDGVHPLPTTLWGQPLLGGELEQNFWWKPSLPHASVGGW